MSPGQSFVCDYENEAGGISIQEVLGNIREMVAMVERQGWKC